MWDILYILVNTPTKEEVENIANGSTIVSHLYPAQNQEILENLTAKNVNAFAMDQVPRVTIAQAYDVLSSLGCFRSDTLDSKLQKVFLIPRVTQVKSDKFGWKTRCN